MDIALWWYMVVVRTKKEKIVSHQLGVLTGYIEMPIVGVKTGGSRVGGPDLCVKADGNKKQGTQVFTQVRALSMEVKPYFLLD